MASPVVASTTTLSESGNTSSRNLTKPTGTTSGDWLLLIVFIDGTTTGSFAASDFETALLVANSSMIAYVGVRLCGGSEPASYTVTSVSESGGYCLMRITGSSATTSAEFINAMSVASLETSAYIPSLPVYATTPDTLIIRACGCDASAARSITDPASHTSIFNATAPSTASTSISVCSVDKAASGYVAMDAFTLSGTEEGFGLTLAIASGVTEDSLTTPVLKGMYYHMPTITRELSYQKPWGTVDGETLLLLQSSDTTGILTASASMSPAFTAIDETSNTATWSNAGYRIASGEGSSYTGSSTSSSSKQGVLMRIKNAHASTPLNQNSVATGTDAAPTATTITPTVDNCLVFTGFAADDDDITNGSGFTSGWEQILALESTIGNDCSFLWQFKQQSTAAATGSVAMTLDLAEEWIAHAFAIAPPAAGGGGGKPDHYYRMLRAG